MNTVKRLLKQKRLVTVYKAIQRTYYLRLFSYSRIRNCKAQMRRKRREGLKTIFLLGEAVWKNMGDQAQTFCIEEWLKQFYREFQLCRLSNFELSTPYFDMLAYLTSNIKKNDLIFFQSGYHTTDMFDGMDITGTSQHQMHRKIVQRFPNNKIVFMPQTVNFVSEIEAERTAAIYNSHPDLTFIARDARSYQTAKELFADCKVLCIPDIVNLVIGHIKPSQSGRAGILFCMRERDQESNHSEQTIQQLRTRLEASLSVETEITDTSLDVSVAKIVKNRERYMKQMIQQFSEKKLVITNRYHGVVFSMAANTPVIVLPTKDHKVTEGIKMYPEEFKPYIRIAYTEEEVLTYAAQILSEPERSALSTVMYERYYRDLKALIEG